MSESSNRSYKTSKTESEKMVKELSYLTRMPEKKIRSLLDSYTMTEIRNGRMVGREWMPLESVKVDKNL